MPADRLRDRFSKPYTSAEVADATHGDAPAASALRTNTVCSPSFGNPMVIELREWSRLAAEHCEQERVRLGNRIRQQLWRYYPQLLEIHRRRCRPWVLELWSIAPTPAKGEHLRKAAVEQLLKRYRIRRIDAETVLRNLRQPAIKVAEGVAAAASVHIRSLIVRLHLVNRELRDAEHKLDELCASRAQALSRMPRSGTGASRRRAASWDSASTVRCCRQVGWLILPMAAGLPPR